MPIDLRFRNLKNSPVGEFLADLKDVGKEIGFNVLCCALTPKGCRISNTRRRLLGLKDKGYFDISVENNKSFFRLTTKGMRLAELLKFCAGKIKWDGRWRVLIFDIPEKEKHKRDSLRKRLSELNFKQLQESAWITPYPVPESLTDFLADLRVRPYLYSLTVESVNREDELRKKFNLK